MLKSEPVLSAAAISGAIIAIASIFGVVLNTGLVETIVAAVLPIALALLAREHVTPVRNRRR